MAGPGGSTRWAGHSGPAVGGWMPPASPGHAVSSRNPAGPGSLGTGGEEVGCQNLDRETMVPQTPQNLPILKENSGYV